MENIENNVTAFVLVKAEQKDVDTMTALLGFDQVVELRFVTGEIPYIAKISTTTNNELGKIIGEISAIDGVQSTQAFVVLQTLKLERSSSSVGEHAKRRGSNG